MGDKFQPMPNVSELHLAVFEMLTHTPALGFAVNDLTVRLLAGDMRYNWWYVRGRKHALEEVARDPRRTFLSDIDLALEYSELIDSFMECWRSWKAEEASDEQFAEVLKSTVLQIEEKLRELPNPPWGTQDT